MGYEARLVTAGKAINGFLDKFPKIHNVYLIALISCVSGMMFGFDISSMSAFIGTPMYKNYFNNPGTNVQGFITSAMALGSFFGSLACTSISEPLGRRFSLILCAFFWCVGAAIQSSSQNRAQLIIGRIISGVGVGFGSTVAPVYGSELAPRNVRGFIGGMFQFSVTVGILVMFYICFGLGKIHGQASFRIAWGIQIVPGLMLFFGVFFLPESPRWLAKNGYWEESLDVVAKLQAKGERSDPDVLIEMSEIKDQILSDVKSEQVTYLDLFRKKYLARTLTAVSAQIEQQLSGINVTMYYVVYIFNMAGFTGNTNLIASSIQYVLNLACTVPALFLLDRVGRRPVLITGAILMMAFQFGIGGLLATYSVHVDLVDGNTAIRIRIPEDQRPAAHATIAMCYLFVCSFAASWGVGIWIYCSEVWGDNVIRQRGAAVSTAANWAFNFAIGMYTPDSFKNIDWKTYFIYATFCGVMAIHVFFGFPETKGKRLEEIGQMWEENVLPWKSASWKPTIPIVSDQKLADKMAVHHDENTNSEAEVNSSKREDELLNSV